MSHTKEAAAFAVLSDSGCAIRIWWSGAERERAERIAKEDFNRPLVELYAEPVLREVERQRDELLTAARAAADLLTRQKWNPDDTFNPEAVVLRGLLDAIATAAGRKPGDIVESEGGEL